jgi:Asp/Glu/hydantoin racemase
MPRRTLVLLHTAAPVAALYGKLAAEILSSDTEILHIVDEVVIRILLSRSEARPLVRRRVAEHVIAAEQAGADAVMVTCPSIAMSLETVRQLVGIPVLRMDVPMADRAVSLGNRIGVVGVVDTTVQATAELIEARASLAGATVTVHPALREDAADAARKGDRTTFEHIVRATVRELAPQTNVIVLAHGSMIRLADAIPPQERTVPVLASPRLGFEYARSVIERDPPQDVR